MSHDKIYTSSVSIVRINGNMIPVGAPILNSFDVTKFGHVVLGRACSSHVKVMLQHVLGHANIHTYIL